MIADQTYNLLKTRYYDRIENLTVDEVRIGLFMTAVRLSDGSSGVSSSCGYSYQSCANSDRDFGEFTPLKIRGRRAIDILESKKNIPTVACMRNAVLSAISSGIVSSGNYNIVENTDPIQLLDLDSPKKICIVGAFHSYIRKIAETKNSLRVLELSEDHFAPEHRHFFAAADDYKEILPESNVVIITGQTLVNNTIDDLLSVISEGTYVILSGPSSSLIPDVLFENKVSVIGSTRITKPELLLDLVSEGAGGYHLFEYCAQKICIMKDR